MALGPVTKIPHTQSDLIRFAAFNYDIIDDAFSVAGIHEFLGANWFTSSATTVFCELVVEFCEMIERLFVSHDPQADDQDRFKVLMGHEPNGSSV